MNNTAATTKQIPFFDYPSIYKIDVQGLSEVIKDVCSRGAYILQKDVKEFEANLAEFTGAKYAIGVANGTDALIIALRAAGISNGDEVIFCTHTYVATAASIHFNGAIPIPVECGSDHMIDPKAIEAAITSKTKAIMPTQLNGRTADMDEIQKIAKKYNLQIIEDAAQALGSTYKGKSAGTFGVAGTISFYPAKNLGCFGDGGAILTNDDNLYEKMYYIHDHGRDENWDIVCWGLNSRLDNLQAAILNYKLMRYRDRVKRRREIAALYNDNLCQVKELHIPPGPLSNADNFDVFQNYEIEAENRDELKNYLQSKGIGTIIQWGGILVHQMSKLGFDQSLPFAEKMMSKSLLLPLYPGLSDENIHYICDMIKSFYSKG
ncbi:DegT/DnrJ/EryC1/StrS family aminotransferase [Candidatus Margulisiibacteriota bacterium]